MMAALLAQEGVTVFCIYLLIFPFFFFFFKKKNILVVTWYLFLERVHAAEPLLSSFALEEADVPPGS